MTEFLFWLYPAYIKSYLSTISKDDADALRFSLLWQLVARVGMEVYNILTFTSSYTDITAAEVSSMVGYLLYAVILYGGVAFLAEEGLRTLWTKRARADAA